MSTSSPRAHADAFPFSGMTAEPSRNPVRDRLAKAKREAIESAMGKGESWATKLVNGESGVRLDDIPLLLSVLNLKCVDKSRVCIDPELARSYETIARKAMRERSLFEEDAE